jgi:hypothetical protein
MLSALLSTIKISMKNIAPNPKNEWSVEPVNFEERPSLVAGLVRLLQTLERHLVERDAKWDKTPNASERVIR